jgi:hypothetical protein
VIDPRKVISPKDQWSLIDVLVELGGPEANWWALALGKWNGVPCLAARWSGADSLESMGNPQSRGYPTWFILPDELATQAKELIPPQKRALVEAILTETMQQSRF